jgi:hypothetical protein
VCRRGVAAVVRDVLGSLRSPKLRAYFVWVPILAGDTQEAARLEASLYPDRRIAHFWDEGAHLSSDMGVRLGLKRAWDVYVLYDRRARWNSSPSLWMHQLDEVHDAPWLDSVKLRQRVEELLSGKEEATMRR